MRLFIALELEESIQDDLMLLSHKLKPFVTKGRFSRKEQLHLTLRFIGETPEENRLWIRQAIEKAVQDVSPFTLTLSYLGHFQRRNAFIVWAGIQENRSLMELQENINKGLQEYMDFPLEDRPYTPHITLGRNIQFNTSWEGITEQVAVPKTISNVTAVTLFQSTQVNGLLEYIPLERVEFTH